MGPYRRTTCVHPAPYAHVAIWDEVARQQIADFDGLLDTGADRTCVPKDAIQARRRYGYFDVLDFNGNKSTVPYIRVQSARIDLLNTSGTIIKSIVTSDLKLILNDEALIGRDIANFWTANLVGPGLHWNVT